MRPDDPTHVSAVCQSLRGACYEQCTVTVAQKAPKTGGVAFKVTRGGSTFWLQAKSGRADRYGGIRYAVRNKRGVDVGPIGHARDYSRLYEACEHLALHLDHEAPRERAPSAAWPNEDEQVAS